MRLIDADEIPYVESPLGCLDDYTCRHDINEMPTIDAVEVVRCKDCRSHNMCNFEQYQGLEGFCSYGERKTE